ncbi:MAG: reactive intermediate/imine deaminase [Bacteroidetes bacterium CG2_30_32_10]|nr:MAG: reactive intermediate/imine deaminase [Bacteroidetes bacterium CG2_30_32_10]
MKRIINTTQAPKPIGPYSQAIMANDTLYVSGQIPVNPISGKIDSTDIELQTKQVMENIKAILKEAGMNFNNVVKTSIFIMDMANFSKINAVYGSYFTSDFPARETVQVAKLPLGADVEISVIAV